VLTRVVNRVIDEAQRVGRFGPRVDRTFGVQFEELTTAPIRDVAGAVARLSDALAVASDRG
jgi:hypothetical protein